MHIKQAVKIWPFVWSDDLRKHPIDGMYMYQVKWYSYCLEIHVVNTVPYIKLLFDLVQELIKMPLFKNNSISWCNIIGSWFVCDDRGQYPLFSVARINPRMRQSTWRSLPILSLPPNEVGSLYLINNPFPASKRGRQLVSNKQSFPCLQTR